MLPRGNAGKRYIDEITRLMGAWINDSPMKNIVFKAIMVMPNLLLQKPSKQSKAKDHLNALDRRINLWISEELVLEGETIQKCLKSVNRPKSILEISKMFRQEMEKGNVNGAMKLLTDNMQNGVLPLNEQTLNMLKQKHPEGKKSHHEALLTDIPDNVHHVKFDSINADLVKKAAAKTQGGAGPSGMDAEG